MTLVTDLYSDMHPDFEGEEEEKGETEPEVSVPPAEEIPNEPGKSDFAPLTPGFTSGSYLPGVAFLSIILASAVWGLRRYRARSNEEMKTAR